MPEYDFDEDRDIWDKEELNRVNRMRKNEDAIPIVVRDKQQPFGLRAHPEMTYGRTTLTIFKPWHSDFLNILLFLGFATYEWLQCALILLKMKKYYDLPN